MYLALTGSTTATDLSYVRNIVQLFKQSYNITGIISRGSKGIDAMAHDVAKSLGIAFWEILPDWERFGNRAGIIANGQLVDVCHFAIVFWDGHERGPADFIGQCREQRVPCFIFAHEKTNRKPLAFRSDATNITHLIPVRGAEEAEAAVQAQARKAAEEKAESRKDNDVSSEPEPEKKAPPAKKATKKKSQTTTTEKKRATRPKRTMSDRLKSLTPVDKDDAPTNTGAVRHVEDDDLPI